MKQKKQVNETKSLNQDSEKLTELMELLPEVIKTYKETFFPLKNMFNEYKETWKVNQIITSFLDELGLQKNEKTIYVAYERIANLKTNILKSYLDEASKQAEKNTKNLKVEIPNKLDDRQKILNKAYIFVSNLYNEYFEQFIEKLKEKNLLYDFYITLFEWSLQLKKAFDDFYYVWSNHIEKQNEILDKRFENNSEKIMAYLKEKDLLEKDENGNYTDRSYTIIRWWKMLSYAEAFPSQINKLAQSIDDFIKKLQKQENNEKQAIVDYLQAIKEAYLETDTTKLLWKWQQVDEKWMQVKWPFQIVHPMEYYDDKYRKAVQPEFDIRVLDVETLQSKVQKDISFMFEKLFSKFDKQKYEEIYNFSKESFSRVLLFISEPVIYGGWYMNWLFSAQVVPNDETISKKFGKKIFAFPNKVREEQKKAPIKKHIAMTFEKDFINEYKQLLDDAKTYYHIYDVETIWHEFGHTLWMGDETEIKMNLKTWNFKNIEEWKATTWWLIAYFVKQEMTEDGTRRLSEDNNKQVNSEKWIVNNENTELWKQDSYSELVSVWQDNISEFDRALMLMHFRRSIALMERKKFDEVAPYYNEGLIHLDILYKSGVLQIKDNKAIFNFTTETYKKLKQLYLENYEKLIKIYLDKKDAGDFLSDYVIQAEDGYNLPKNEELRKFVVHYQELFEKYGNEVIQVNNDK